MLKTLDLKATGTSSGAKATSGGIGPVDAEFAPLLSATPTSGLGTTMEIASPLIWKPVWRPEVIALSPGEITVSVDTADAKAQLLYWHLAIAPHGLATITPEDIEIDIGKVNA